MFPRTLSGNATGGHTGSGVGLLPGPLNEAAFTTLPDERYMTTAAAAALLAADAYALKDRVAGALPNSQDAQAAKDNVQAKAQSAAQTMKQAAPGIPGITSSHSTAVTAPTVPTREHFGAQPGDHSSGAGALPGLLEEPHFARLPEESAHSQYDWGPMDTCTQIALKPTEETFGNESSVALTPDERAGHTASGVSGTTGRALPSQEPLGNEAVGSTKCVGGVDALVGNFNKSGAAALPDERGRGQGTGTSTVTQPTKTKKEEAPSVPLKDDAAKNKADAGGDKHLSDKSGTHGAPNKGSGYDTDYHPANMHPAAEGSIPAEHASEDAQRPAEEARPSQSDASTPEKAPPPAQEKAKKAGLMDKMRGEAKVLLGKIEHRPANAEQGQRLKAGEAAPST
ncbi:hypothetical protein C2E23DRAFT_903306 [Lenzites betulinus]|nr:hypothetical protein C2E23DRAFT_903306 [Lenzites betulinus]